MNNKRITLRGAAKAELEEKKSVFIAYAAPVRSEDEAKQIIEQRKREYSDATHNVWAYYIDNGAKARYSDDGEPQGTAGIPVLNVLKMSGATDLCVVVTRYFGGTLLGAGGLVRAYGAAAKLALDSAGIAVNESFAVLEITVGYPEYQKLTVHLRAMGAVEDSADFGEKVRVVAAIEAERENEIITAVRDITNAKGTVSRLCYEERPSNRD